MRSAVGPGELLTDVYMAVLGVVMTSAIVLGASARLGTDLATDAAAGSGLQVGVGWLVLLAGCAAVLGATALTARLGPVWLSPAQSVWWLPLPVERRSLLRPAAAPWPALLAAVGGFAGTAVALVVGSPPAALAVAGAGAGATAGFALGLAQAAPAVHRRARLGVDVAGAAVPMLGLAVVLLSPPPPRPPDPVAYGAAAVAAGLAVVSGILLDRRLGRTADLSLRERGLVTGEALGATLSVDTRALARALSAAGTPSERSRSARMTWLRRVPRRLAPHLALVTGEVLVLVRSRRHLIQLVAAACLPGVALAVPAPVLAVTAVLLAAGSYLAALALAEGSRRAEDSPMLDALLPLGARTVRLLRLVAPSAGHAAWSLAVFAMLASRYPDAGLGWWLLLGVLGSPVWAAGAVRAAYREPPDFSGPLIHTPMGSIPPGMAKAFREGPDVAVLGAIPAFIAVVTAQVSPVLVLAQVVCTTVGVLAVVTSRGRSRPRAG
ncbi:DUF6297 family protein [Georgenia deserti]|uniref:DUF6297 family protein n=1 Tax=Georgenia deserti TaxID=2093781 RepID=A0ABW4L474_9MICO